MTVEQYVDIANSTKRNRDSLVKFERDIFKHTLKWEGGNKLHKVSGDSGGWTLWGIAYNHNKKVFKNFADFKDTTYEEAAAIAFVKYYLTAAVYLVPEDAQLMYFDMCYNLGARRAIKLVQRCAGIKDDGIIGPVTRKMAKKVEKECLYQQRKGFYNMLARRRRKFVKFLNGWLNRTEYMNKQ